MRINYFNDNMKILKVINSDLYAQIKSLQINDNKVINENGNSATIEFNSDNLPILFWNNKQRLTSTFSPIKEDQAIAAQFNPQFNKNILLIGLGIGYSLELILNKLDPLGKLFIYEPYPELIAAAFQVYNFQSVLKDPRVKFLNLLETKKLIQQKSCQVIWRPLLKRLKFHENLNEKNNLKKIKHILFFYSSYYLNKEIINAIKELNIELTLWKIVDTNFCSNQKLKELLDLIINKRPDLIFTVNHLGFDQEGVLSQIFQRLEIPIASWFVDSPKVIIGLYEDSNPYLNIFTWDKSYLDYLIKIGFKNVYHLPLASDNNFFYPSKVSSTNTVAFIGDSLEKATIKYLNKLNLNNSALSDIDGLAAKFLNSDNIFPEVSDNNLIQLNLQNNLENQANLEALIIWRASRLKRIAILKELNADKLVIAGDYHWKTLINVKNCFQQEIDYYQDLKNFYLSHDINLNITSRQMKSGLNQRVFDVPACKAFLLTDKQSELEENFILEQEVICYSSIEELKELSNWFLKRPKQREAIAEQAYKRVLKDHLYKHRLAKLLQIIQDNN